MACRIPPARCPELPACHPRRDAVEPYRLRRADALISDGARIRIRELISDFWLSREFSRTTAVGADLPELGGSTNKEIALKLRPPAAPLLVHFRSFNR